MLGLLPSGGAGRLSQLILPVMVLSFHTSGAIARVAQANMQVVLQADFIRTARAKGLSEPRVILTHAMRAALVPVMGVIALQAGFLLSGTVIVESLFVRPGVGRLLLDATIQQDYPVVLGVVVWSALIYSMVNLIADVLYPVFDPRVSF
jgi:ABC-type dipeptide/oligopeptide/nickel transport system permease component